MEDSVGPSPRTPRLPARPRGRVLRDGTVVEAYDGSNRRYVKRKVDVFSLVDIFRQLVGDCDCHQPPKWPRPSSSLSGNPLRVNRHGPADPEDKAVRGVLAAPQRDAARRRPCSTTAQSGGRRRRGARPKAARGRGASARGGAQGEGGAAGGALLAERADRGVKTSPAWRMPN